MGGLPQAAGRQKQDGGPELRLRASSRRYDVTSGEALTYFRLAHITSGAVRGGWAPSVAALLSGPPAASSGDVQPGRSGRLPARLGEEGLRAERPGIAEEEVR